MSFLNKIKISQPKTIFLIDSLGAWLSAFFLFAVLRPYHELVGLPENVLALLAGIAISLSVFSLSAYFWARTKWRVFLGTVALMNTLYVLFTLVILVIHRETLSLWGLLYFIGELFIVLTLIGVEIRFVSNRLP